MPVNPNYAPPGFEAVEVEAEACHGCAFEHCDAEVCDAICEANGIDCRYDGRPDGIGVIFVVRQAAPATANFPCDDMGTPV